MTKQCSGCRHSFLPDQLTVESDGGGFCFDCCNETEEKPNMRGALREFLTGLVVRLAKKRNVSPQVVKTKLVGEYYENLSERRRQTPAPAEKRSDRVVN